ncbi:MAG: mechanosensitive ion channel family protein [Saprospiraceae bacterium]|nr:mechanosensitive ion channel family protein [Saprospiraceae bacterium]
MLNFEELSKLITGYAPKLIGALLTLIIGFWLAGKITNLTKKALTRKGVDETVRPFLASLVNVGLKVLVLLSVASMFGIETTSFIAIFSALAFAIGLALQGSLGHFASGVLLLVFKPYKVGDLVTIGGGQTGTVKEIQIFNTILQTLDNKHIIVPNSVVTSNVMTNISGQGIIGVELKFGIAYSASIDLAREVILRVAKECPFVLDEPATGAVVAELADSSVNLATRPFCKSEHYWDTFFYMNEHVKKEFDKAGVGIPFPNVTVHLNK